MSRFAEGSEDLKDFLKAGQQITDIYTYTTYLYKNQLILQINALLQIIRKPSNLSFQTYL